MNWQIVDNSLSNGIVLYKGKSKYLKSLGGINTEKKMK